MSIREETRDASSNSITDDLIGRALLIRLVEQRLLRLFSEGKLFGTVHTCIGQEMTGLAVASALEPGDTICSNHRGHGHFLARTGDVEGLIAEVMGRSTGVCGGRGGSQHLCSRGFFSNGIQGGMTPAAAGLALSHKRLQTNAISVVFIGDGTLGEGIVYETMNLAAKWCLPLLFVLENNFYAQSTPQQQTLAGEILARAAAFGIETSRTDTWDLQDLFATSAEVVKNVRGRCLPGFLEIETFRLMAHSKGDDDRDSAEVARHWERDPLQRFLDQHPAEAERLSRAALDRIDRAVASAEAAPFPSETSGHSFGNNPSAPILQGQTENMAARTECSEPGASESLTPPPTLWSPVRLETNERVVTLIYQALQRNMERDERILLLGEDIEAPYGGAFKLTRDLSHHYPSRVMNTPISEAAIVGVGNGVALAGQRPVCEIMFGDFLALAADQIINHAAKFQYMYNEQVSVPLVIRTPMGGRRGYGPTHSQSLEKHFLGIPGTRVLALHARQDPGTVYDTLFRTIDGPTIVIENKMLYGVRVNTTPPEGYVLEKSDEPFPTVRLRPLTIPDMTLLCYGGMLGEVEAALEELLDVHEIAAEVICPTQLYPLNPTPILESVMASRRLLIVEEGQGFAALGSEVIAQIVESRPAVLQRVRRLGPPPHPIPSCGPLEKVLLPGARAVVRAALDLAAG